MQERELFIAAFEIADPTARRAYLDQTCANDPALRGRIERLLGRVTETADFLDSPAADLCSDFADLCSNFSDGTLTERSPRPQVSDPRTIFGGEEGSPASLPPSHAQLVATQCDEADRAASYGGSDERPLTLGTLFGRYRIDQVLGSGGMGVVYLAQDVRLGRQVALKIPRFDVDGKLHLVERFRREARVMASVQHRNICPIINVDEQDGTHYLTMAWIDGQPLSQMIRNGCSFTAVQIAEWIRKLALALDAAHCAGVVHRDLKPANVIIDRGGEPVLMDFGLAWMAHETDSRVTLAGAIIGTPAYMSPEQAESEPERVGAASDIYSLGVIMYELLAGCPIRTGSVTRVLYKLMHESPIRPSEIRDDVDLQLEGICWKAIARRPEERFATAAEFAEALTRTHVAGFDCNEVLPSAAVPGTIDVPEPSVTRRNRRRVVIASVLLFGIPGLAAAFVVWGNVQSPLTGSGRHLPLAPIGYILAAVNPKYVESTTSYTGTWSTNAMPAWWGTFTAEGLRPAGHYYTPGVCSHDFSGLAGGALPTGTYFTIYSLNQNDHLTLKAYDSAHAVISSPWLNRKPLAQWGVGSGAGFPGLPLPEDMPRWDWNEPTETYTFDGSTITGSHSLTIALSSCRAIGFLEVTRGNNTVSFGLAAPAAAPAAGADRF